MAQEWATEHLQVIRTLMERSAIYRRALAPIMLLTGSLGLLAGLTGFTEGEWSRMSKLSHPRFFVLYWLGVGLIAVAGAYLLVRRQALRDAEPFWSLPTRRVTSAILPAFVVGLVVGLVAALPRWREPLQIWWLPPVWMALYGCALHAAGFFMPRGIRLFGWLFALVACVFLVFVNQRSYGAGMPPLHWAHGVMGGGFGGLHLAYGVYLYFTEKRKNEA
jgi:hypothetical protein